MAETEHASRVALDAADRIIELETANKFTDKRLQKIEEDVESGFRELKAQLSGLSQSLNDSRRPNINVWLYAAALFGAGAMFIIQTQIKPVDTKLDGFTEEQHRQNQSLRDAIQMQAKTAAETMQSYMAQEREVLHSQESQVRELIESKTGLLRERFASMDERVSSLWEHYFDDNELILRNDQALIDFGIKSNESNHVLQGKKHPKKKKTE